MSTKTAEVKTSSEFIGRTEDQKDGFKGFTGNADPLFINRLRMVDAVLGCINYGIYAPWNGRYNRKVNPKSVRAIGASIRQHGFIGTVILVKTKAFSKDGSFELRTLDGQHRIEAAQIAQSPYNYIVVQFQDETDDTKENVTNLIGSLNTTSRGWGYNDFLNAYVSLGKRFYRMLNGMQKDSRKEHGAQDCWKLIDLINICSEKQKGETTERTFKKGGMVFRDDWKQRFEALDQLIVAGMPYAATVRRHIVKFLDRLTVEGYQHFSAAMIKAIKVEGDNFLSVKDETRIDGKIKGYFDKYAKNADKFYRA